MISIYNEIDKNTIKCRQRTARVANKSRENSGRLLSTLRSLGFKSNKKLRISGQIDTEVQVLPSLNILAHTVNMDHFLMI